MNEPSRNPFEARLGSWPDPRLGTILSKRVAEQLKYFPAQMLMDQAHTVMLAEQQIITDHEAALILDVLVDMEKAGVDGLDVSGSRSSLFWFVESTLIDRLGEHVGGKMHTGRSHNDIMPTVSRLSARRDLATLVDAVLDLQQQLIRRADEHVETIMPGYTALQPAQPWTFGHYLVGWAFAFQRDVRRLTAAYESTNQSPLGSSALAGTSWPLDRSRTAALLGFDGVLPNSRDAGFATRDYVAEILATAAIAMNNLSSLCSDLYLWSSTEFDFVELPDGLSGTSSFMPQKKNAWAVDWTRGAAGSLVGDLAGCLASLRGSSSTDGSAQDYPEIRLPKAMETAIDFFRLVAAVVAELRVHGEVMADRVRTNWSTASNLAETLARECDLSFREGHGVVARVVRDAVRGGKRPADVVADDVEMAAAEVLGRSLGVDDATIHRALDPEAFVNSRLTDGSVNPTDVRRQILRARSAQLAQSERWSEEHMRVVEAEQALRGEVSRRISADPALSTNQNGRRGSEVAL